MYGQYWDTINPKISCFIFVFSFDTICWPQNGSWRPSLQSHSQPRSLNMVCLLTNFLASVAQYTILHSLSSALCPRNSFLFYIQSLLHKRPKLEPLLPIFSSIPPQPTPCPDIRLDLTEITKSSTNSTYRQLINKIVSSELPSYLRWFTDGSQSGSRTEYAVTIQSNITAFRMRNTASIFTAELNAIFTCLPHFTTFPLFLNSYYFLISSHPSLLHKTLILPNLLSNASKFFCTR